MYFASSVADPEYLVIIAFIETIVFVIDMEDRMVVNALFANIYLFLDILQFYVPSRKRTS